MYSNNLRLELDLSQLKSELSDTISCFTTLKDDPELKREIMESYAFYCDPYVPYDTGALSDLDTNIYVTKQGTIVYKAKSPYNGYHYADRVYEGNYYKKLTRPAKDGRIFSKKPSKFSYNSKEWKQSKGIKKRFNPVHPKATDHWNLAFEAGPEYKKFLKDAEFYLRDTFAEALARKRKTGHI